MESMCFEFENNQVFNHMFAYADKTGEFPAGWQKYRGRTTADFYWERDDKQNYCVKIKNRVSRLPASICQERSYRIPVYEKQVWQVGAAIKVNHEISAAIKVHFFSPSSSRVIYTSLDFMLEPERDFYCGIVTVPTGVDYALIEIGTSEAGMLSIIDVFFTRVFPVEKYDVDAQGKLNINNVESVTRIIEPVDVNGTFELVRTTRDFSEDVTADTTERSSTMQDVFHLATYSFCVINEGATEAIVQMQLSPNGINWAEDPIADDHIDAGQMRILVYNRFARYVRLKYRTDSGTTDLRIYFQGQG
ncbi:MAG: hypothetical protein CVU90_05270 [Firmicutes bacterium HGW-Firmicutes-15]|nr:MAG: hypothetical protein CVU90_05270 [Firmicutes bacterium HGW-Firmicutes-15]